MEKIREQIAKTPSFADLSEYVNQIERFRDTKPHFAIDSAKGLLEAIAKTILGDKAITLKPNASFPSIIKDAIMSSQVIAFLSDPNSITLLSNGIATASQAIGALRNSFGYSSHGRDLHSEKIDKLSVDFAIDATLSIAHFLLALHEEERTTKPKLIYEDNPLFNLFFDSQYEDSEIVIADINITPSRALFYEDIEAYRIQLNGFRQLKEFLINKLNGLCNPEDLEHLIDYYDWFSDEEIQIIQEKSKSVRFYGEEPVEIKQRFQETFFAKDESETENIPSTEVNP